MAKKNSVYKKGENGSFEFWCYLPTEDVVSALTYTTDIGNISTRLTTAESNIADRYTKGESDGRYLPTDGTAKYANVLKNAPGQYGVDGTNRLSSWDEINAPSWHGIRAQLITSSLQGKNEPDGTIMTFGWDTGHYDTQLLIPGGDSAGKVYNPMLRTQSDSSDYGSWHYIPYMEDVVSALTYTTDIGNINTRLTTAETAIADRYTKGEVDAKTEDKMKIISPTRKYHFDGGGNYRFCKVATITAVLPWANRPIVFEAIGRGMNYCQLISIYPNGSPSASGTTYTNIYKRTNDLYWVMKDEGNGVCSLYVMLSEVWGDLEITRLFYDGVYFSVEMKMEAVSSWPDGVIEAKNIITASTADNATHASSADVATTYTYSRGVYLDATAENGQSWKKAVFGEESADHFHITEVRTLGSAPSHMLADYSSGIAWSGSDTFGALTVRYGQPMAYICGGNGTSPKWGAYLVLSENGSNIADQTVRSFTATEVNHGCKFNGDLQSTTLLYAPKACTIGGLQPSDTNEPYYQNTITGTRSVRFGSDTFNLNFSRNAFIDYYLDHGYHFDEETEASTYYRDTGLLCYNGKMYFCAFKYYSSSNTTDFDASPVLTEADGDAKYLPIDGAEATGFNISDREILVGSSKYVQTLQNKAGTIALKSDIPSVPSVVNNLTSTSTTNPLSAYQGYLLNQKLLKGFRYVAKVDSATWKIPYTSGRVCYLIVGAYSTGIGFNVQNGTAAQIVSYSEPFVTVDICSWQVVVKTSRGYANGLDTPSSPSVYVPSGNVVYVYKIWEDTY